MKKGLNNIVICAICLLILCIIEIYNVHSYTTAIGYMLTTQEYVFVILSSGANISYSAIVYLLMLGDLNHENESQSNSNKKLSKWTFFIKNPLLFVAIVVGFTVILVFPISRNSSEWTELQMIEKGIINSSVIPKYVLMNMDCYEAIALGVIIEMLFLIIADLIACIAINFRVEYIGITIYTLIVEWNNIWISYETPHWFISSCYTLNTLINESAPGHEQETIMRGIAYLLAHVAVLLGINRAIKIVKTNVRCTVN